MPTIIGVCGKGGVGKTVISALISLELINHKISPILIIDADPNSNLNEFLGIPSGKKIVEIIDELPQAKIPPNTPKSEYLEYLILNALVEEKDFDFISMGRPEGPGCYCAANNTLREIIKRLQNKYQYVVIDNEAGMEHLSRRTTRQITKLVVLSDFTLIGIRSAKRIFELVEELSLEVKEKYFVVNKVKGELKELAPGFKETRLTPAAYFPYDEKLEEFSTTALPLTSYQGKVREEVKKWLKIAKVI